MITQFTLKDGTTFILVLCIQLPTAVLRYSSVSDNFTKGEQRQSRIDCGCSPEVTHSTTKPVGQHYTTQFINLSNSTNGIMDLHMILKKEVSMLIDTHL